MSGDGQLDAGDAGGSGDGSSRSGAVSHDDASSRSERRPQVEGTVKWSGRIRKWTPDVSY